MDQGVRRPHHDESLERDRGVDSWLEPYDGKVPLQAYYDQFRYIPEQSSGK